MYIQQDVTLHSLFYLETALHVSSGTTTHHQERKQLYLQHLVFVTLLLLLLLSQVVVTVWQIPDAVVTVVCAPNDGLWYHSKHVEQFPDEINCVTLHLVGYRLEYSNDARTHERWNQLEINFKIYLRSLLISHYIITSETGMREQTLVIGFKTSVSLILLQRSTLGTITINFRSYS
jgi:hypothetical protein